MRVRTEALPDGGLLFCGKRYETRAEYELARERQRARRHRIQALLRVQGHPIAIGDEDGWGPR